ncbi:hypothetical protein [Croceicoccus marinus]|uniref:Uncharacterized protein n=1 Tax=Croceicoccus marinus TaxID=450378 RepID=A0A1Z1F9K6_9SPHN|nr:hypothetical protein [Croceicoccus marinus]ARU15489.1 hypothetical protein A9D14_03990 [Croceicoccus marinus]
MAVCIHALRERPAAPWTVQAHALLAVAAALALWLLHFHPPSARLAVFLFCYLAVTAAYVFMQSAMLRFLMTGFHLACVGVGIAALLLVPGDLRGDPWIPVRGTVVIAVSTAATVLQWLPATRRWIYRP